MKTKHDWKWLIGILLTILTISGSGIAFMDERFVSKDTFKVICDRLESIDRKLDSLVSQHTK